MELMDKTKLIKYKTLALKHLGNPMKLRLFTIGTLLIAVFFMIYMPLSDKINLTEKQIAAEKERNSSIAEYEKLQKQVEAFHGLIAEQSDTNEWIQYLLDGLRQFQVKLRGMESKQQKKVGPYKAVAVSMEVEGPYPELKKFVEWIESSQRILRIDMLQFKQEPKSLLMKILILGILPKK